MFAEDAQQKVPSTYEVYCVWYWPGRRVFTLFPLFQEKFALEAELGILCHRFPVAEPIQICADEKHGILLGSPSSGPVESRSDILNRNNPVVNVLHLR
jgi:hypothetical protein